MPNKTVTDTSKGVTEVQALTPEELAEIEAANEYWIKSFPIAEALLWNLESRRLCFTIRQRDKRIEELEAQLKEKKQ